MFILFKFKVSRIHGSLTKSFFHWKVRLFFGVAIGGLVGLVYLISKKVCTASFISLFIIIKHNFHYLDLFCIICLREIIIFFPRTIFQILDYL